MWGINYGYPVAFPEGFILQGPGEEGNVQLITLHSAQADPPPPHCAPRLLNLAEEYEPTT
jgi:hypothetical protein